MSLTEQAGTGRAGDRHEALDFGFVPTDLAKKCGQLIHTHHRVFGYATLADILWDEEAREFIAAHPKLQAVLRKASTTRSGRIANNSYLLLATIILSLEVLASDFAGWGTRFPRAKWRACGLMTEFFPTSRSRLMDTYLPPRTIIPADLLRSMAPAC